MPLPLAPDVVAEFRRRFPALRDDYFNYLMSVGWGETEAGPMIYEGPTTAEEIYGQRDALAGILLLGDDFQGYYFSTIHKPIATVTSLKVAHGSLGLHR